MVVFRAINNMMDQLAVIKTGGKQYLVSSGKKIKVEKLDAKEGEEVVFQEVLLLAGKDTFEIGRPLIEKALVKGKVLSQDRHDKIIVFRYKPKKRYKVKKGHKQPYTEVEITSIEK
jgi:large subunit ribosomal protein L21